MQVKKLQLSGMFVRFFAGIWITLIVAGAVCWGIAEMLSVAPSNYGSIETGRFAQRAVANALTIMRLGGQEALIEWLLDRDSNTKPEVFVIDRDGNEISGRKVPERALASLLANDEDAQEGVWTCRGGNGGRHHRNMHACAGYRLFAVRTDIPPRHYIMALWRMPWWVLIGLLSLISIGVAGLLAWGYTRPLHKLQWAMRKTSQGVFDVRIANEIGHQHDEIGALARQYDAMAEKINGLFERQKTLFHDVSHELRSPLARISVAIELAEKDPAKATEFLERIERDASQLNALVDELLTYARLDENAPIEFQPVDLVPILEDIVSDADFEGSAGGTQVTLTAPKSIEVNIHVDSLMHAVENLVRNALRYSGPGQQVRVDASVDGTFAVVKITDSGPGMEPDELERIFEPFVRGKTQPTGGGFGLGLAIAKRAAERHGGTLKAENVKPHGLCMTVRIPLSGPQESEDQ